MSAREGSKVVKRRMTNDPVYDGLSQKLITRSHSTDDNRLMLPLSMINEMNIITIIIITFTITITIIPYFESSFLSAAETLASLGSCGAAMQ